MITANSFMKREFGKKLIEEFFPKVDLTHVIDTSPAHPAIASHGTATVILFGATGVQLKPQCALFLVFGATNRIEAIPLVERAGKLSLIAWIPLEWLQIF